MITIDDVLGLCECTRDEIDAIAEHEHIPEIAAAALAAYLVDQPGGPARILEMIRDDVRHAIERGDRAHARELVMALRHFLSEHPEALEQRR